MHPPKPWQIVATWLRRMDQSPLQSALLGDGCSTGKTYTTLYSIVADTGFFEAQTADEKLTAAADSYTSSLREHHR